MCGLCVYGCWSKDFLEVTGFSESPFPSAEKWNSLSWFEAAFWESSCEGRKTVWCLADRELLCWLVCFSCPLPVQSDKLSYRKS